MEIRKNQIDDGRAFDFGRTSADYAKYRDIYPPLFYEKIAARGLGIKGQKVLDLGTGTGVLPRNMYRYGAEWIGTDISENQIAEAVRLAGEGGMNINFFAAAAEDLDFPAESFDLITACQCFWYFDFNVLAPKLANMLKSGCKVLLLYMAWLPFEDEIAAASENLVRKYSPSWSGHSETVHPIKVADCVFDYFDEVYHEEYRLDVPFSRIGWHGRMRSCRGVGASLSPDMMKKWETEHLKLLKDVPDEFTVKHYAAMLELKKK